MTRFIKLPVLKIGQEPSRQYLIALDEIQHFSTRIENGESVGSWIEGNTRWFTA